jgi:Ca2+-binding EF-hand superfamily protein
MKTYDADGDGKVTREEFTGPARMFTFFDQDQDGIVTKEEVQKASAAQRSRRSRAPNYDWIFKRLDRDDDGQVDLADLQRVLKEADADEDGKIGKDEWKAYLAKNSKHLSGHQAPKVGQAAPNFTLHPLEGDAKVTLDKLLAKKMPVVLLFGSFT